MCGIVVTIGNPSRGWEMLNKIKHRGNTSKGLIFDNIGLFHRRLAIQGLDSKYDCPFTLSNQCDIVLFNGEIYNYKELDHNAKSDIEIFNDPLGLRRERWDGDFAYVKFNKNNFELEVLTDRFGKRQLYYRVDGIGISGISSEIKALIKEDDKIDNYYMATVARFGYFFGQDNTIVKNIKRFIPGIKYTINDFGKIINQERIKWDSDSMIPEDYPRDFQSLFELSLQRRLTSDIPISFLYSGGIDSSIILFHLNKLGIIPKIFTIDNSNDVQYAEKYANELSVGIDKLKLENYNTEEIYLKTESYCDLGSVIPNYLLFQAVKNNNFNVVLTGDSCDELFSGYSRNKLFDYQQNDIFNELIFYHFPRLDKEAMVHTVEYRSPYSADYLIDFALKIPYLERIDKKFLKNQYKGLIPDYILNREKEPLKIESIRNNKEDERLNLCKLWKDKLFEVFKNENRI